MHAIEERTEPHTAYCFDVDGVLTDPQKKRVVIPDIFEQIARRLQHGLPVGLITGRSLEFMIERIIDPLLQRYVRSEDLRLLFAIGEKGGVWITHSRRGTRVIRILDDYGIPEDIRVGAQTLAEDDFADSMFWDAKKRCMVSIEYLDPDAGGTVSFERFKEEQRVLADRLVGLLSVLRHDNPLEIDVTTIATDLQDKRLGKGLAARRFLALLSERNITPERFVCFGDSISDHDMHVAFLAEEKKSIFVFVGEEQIRFCSPKDTQVFTYEHFGKVFDRGTYLYLCSESF